jgi:RNA polymerase sigma-70 factor (ECF subfamily)
MLPSAALAQKRRDNPGRPHYIPFEVSVTVGNEHIEGLVRAHWAELRAMLTVLTGNLATAEDLAQEVFALAVRRGLEPGSGARQWLRKAARYLALNERRRRRPAAMAPDEVARLAESDPASPPEREPAFEETLAALRKCVEELQPSDRELLAARYERSVPLERVAADSAQSVGYVKQRLFRLRRRLGECVKRRLDAVNP